MTCSQLEVKRSTIPLAGLGLYTKQKIQKGEVVAELSGEFLTMDEATRRDDKRYLFQYMHITSQKLVFGLDIFPPD